jgi:hypothetical protein
MNRSQANRILDQLKAGEVDYSTRVIRQALFATGDLADDPPPRVFTTSGRDDGWVLGVRYAQAHRAPKVVQ